MDGLNPKDNVISYLPPAWVGDHLFSLAQWLVAGFTINCPESAATISIDLREIGPTYYFAPPRVFEGMLTSVSIRMEDAAPFKRWMYSKAMDLARRVGSDILDGKPVGLMDRLMYTLGDVTIYGPLRNVMGLSRIRVAYTAGAAIGPDLFRFFRSIGINLKQLYGSTETAVFVCLQPDNEARAVIKALDRALLSSELAGRITSLPRRPGDAFKKGDLLVAIDCDLYNAQSAKVAAEHKGARLKMENARQLQELRSIGALEVTTAESDFAQTQAALRIAQINAGRCSINAPWPGRCRPEPSALPMPSRDRHTRCAASPP